ncbi:MAG TPA: sugar transferase [Fimbriiglobus sp.]|jgi:lipopolysaccharide/colanic/teichoic acid biosynthesis glycosyltransferase|nr:sugar transferase [Fimbriiglobus sp.]
MDSTTEAFLVDAGPAGLVCESSSRRIYERVKDLLDFGLGVILLVATAPVIAAAALLVRLTSSGPAIYSQTRLGRGGRRYQIYKLRTMYHNCELKSGIKWASKGDARITPLGRFLRATHLDELPQLWNVLRGEMSLVGPRPERPEIADKLADAISGYHDRTTVKPGVTGLAQILLPPDTNMDSVRRKLSVDQIYVLNRSVWLDARILLGTWLHVFKVPPTWIRGLLALPVEDESIR